MFRCRPSTVTVQMAWDGRRWRSRAASSFGYNMVLPRNFVADDVSPVCRKSVGTVAHLGQRWWYWPTTILWVEQLVA